MKDRKANLRDLNRTQVGDVPCVEDRAAMALARAIHYAESKACSISWSAQERAEAYFNEHGMASTLTECARLGFPVERREKSPRSEDAQSFINGVLGQCKGKE